MINILLIVLIGIQIANVVLNLIILITSRKKVDKPRIKYTLQAMFGRKNYHRLLTDCRGDCNSCPFTTCLEDDCEEYKKRIKNNDSEISPWIQSKYKVE